MAKCAYVFCTSNALKEDPSLKFVPFPKPWLDIERAKRWIQLCGIKYLVLEDITRHTYVCSKHFHKNVNLDWRYNHSLEPFAYNKPVPNPIALLQSNASLKEPNMNIDNGSKDDHLETRDPLKTEVEDISDIFIPEAPKVLRLCPESISSTNKGQTQTSLTFQPQRASKTFPGIRVRQNLSAVSAATSTPASPSPSSSSPSSSATKANLPKTSPIVVKPKINLTQINVDVAKLKEEVRALQWLARRKEQEWDQVLRLLKKKEEKLMRTERMQTLAKEQVKTTAQTLIRRVVNPVQPGQVQPGQVQPGQVQPGQVTTATSQLLVPTTLSIPNGGNKVFAIVSSANSSSKIIQVQALNPVTKATATATVVHPVPSLPTEARPQQTSHKVDPVAANKCQRCKVKDSQFVCAGCSNRRYCSRNCQVIDWDEHSEHCDESNS